jgi:hypothetical protein
VREFQSKDAYVLFVISPFASWDQETCHPEKMYESHFDPKKGGKLKVGKPCDMKAYKNFLRKLVERYDGDGIDDMPGLKIPIKYWEILNEPSMQDGDEKFFVGTSEEYLDILKTSYETIKEADPEAKVLHAGIAGMDKEFQEFWDPIMSEAKNYFDIANIHSITTDEKREDLNILKFKKFLEKHNINNKPIWVTEVQFGELDEEPEDIEKFNFLMIRSSVFSLALGADKLFYIQNWLYWKDSEKMQRAYETLVKYINDFDKIEVLAEKYKENEGDFNGFTSIIGQYKFIQGPERVYVLWGNAKLPEEISGKIKVTDIYGESKIINSSEFILSEKPVFVELVS